MKNLEIELSFLGAFAKLLKATINFVISDRLSVCLSVRPSVRMSACNNSDPNGMIFIKFDISVFFENLSRKFKFHSNRGRLTGNLHEHLCTLWQYLAHFFFEWEALLVKIVQKSKHIFYVQKPFTEHHAVYKIMWKNKVEPTRSHMTI